MDEDKIYDTWPDAEAGSHVRDHALAARDWLDGEEIEGWESLVVQTPVL